MRPHTIQPAREITQLALSPDGQRFGVVQEYRGFRSYDALTGAEVGPEPESGLSSAQSPTNRHHLTVYRSQVRLAEMAAGRPWSPFQTGWTRDGDLNRPPSAPETLPLPAAPRLMQAAILAKVFDRWGRAPQPAAGQTWAVLNGALSADHRFAVGRFLLEGPKLAVCDLACESLATNLDMSAAPAGSEYVRPAFGADGRRVFAAAYTALFVFDLPPVGLAAVDLPVEAPVLKPALLIPVTQPQPETSLVPPFAVLPCGTKILLRGAKSRVELRDLATGELLTAWQWLRKVTALAVAADGLTAAAGGASGRVVIWDLG